MTNSEYFEENNISFSESMKLFNKSKFDSFDEFLKSEYTPSKFKAGDIIVMQLNEETLSNNWKHNVVFKVINTFNKYRTDWYMLKLLTPTEYNNIGHVKNTAIEFIDRNCKLY